MKFMKSFPQHIYSLFWIILLAPLFLVNCNDPVIEPKEEPKLPPITHTGAGTFGCYIDDALFLPDPGSYTYWYARSTGELRLSMKSFADYYGLGTYAWVVLNCDTGVFGEGIYPFDTTDILSKQNSWTTVRIDKGSHKNYRTGFKASGYLNVTHFNDTGNSLVISGEFEIYVRRVLNPMMDSLHLTQGRFDIKFQ